MKLNFKPLSSFFSRKESEEKKEENEETQACDDQVTDGDDQGDDQDEEKEDEQEQTCAEAKETSTVVSTVNDAMVSVSVKEYKSFVAAQTELQKFGKNVEDRNSFLKDAAQLQAWYEAAAATGATSNGDANAQEKSTKKLSKVTQEAKAAYLKAASQRKKIVF
jgi:hypothetical protein